MVNLKENCMPRTTKKFKSVAVPYECWKDLWKISIENQRSPAQQIAFFVDLFREMPNDKNILNKLAGVMNVRE